MTKITSLIILFFSFIMISCSSGKKNIEPKETKVETIVEPVVAKPTFERLPGNLVQKIFNDCNNIDITFYNSSKTINLWDDNVKHILTMIMDEAPLQLDNNPIGHIMMQKDGEQLAFVEISMKGNLNYAIYNIDDKKYYNKINEKGLEFFSKFANE